MTSSQVPSGEGIHNNIMSSTDSEFSAMLRSAQMELLQRHIQEWQQLSDMRSSMQNMGFADAQLQLQTIALQMQLHDAWKQMFQQDNGELNQQQSATTVGTAQNNFSHPNQQAMPNMAFQQVNNDTYQQQILTAPNNTHNNTNLSSSFIQTTSGIYNVQATQTTNPSSHHPQQQAPAENVCGQDYSSWMSTLQNNLTDQSISATEYHAVPNGDQAHGNLHQQLQSQLALQTLQAQLSQAAQEKMGSNANNTNIHDGHQNNSNNKDPNRVVAKSA